MNSLITPFWGPPLFALAVLGVYIGATALLEQGTPPATSPEVPNIQALEEAVQRQLACEPSACFSTFERWEEGRKYPENVMKDENARLRAELDRKCSRHEGQLSDCYIESGLLEDQIVLLQHELDACRGGSASR
jgi:hypothetical protein